MKQYVSIDVGGTKMRLGLMKLDKEPELLSEVTLPVIADFSQAVQEITKQVKKLVDPVSLAGVSIALPGAVDGETLLNANNLMDWNHQPIKRVLEKHLGVPVTLLHDGAAAALGEAVYGRGQSLSSFLHVTWGTGIGGVRVLRDQGRYQVSYFELAHQIYQWQGKVCTCGQRGCFEAYLGGWALSQQHQMNELSDEDHLWTKIVPLVAHMLINTIVFYPESAVLFGGGLITKRPHLLPQIESVLEEELTYFQVPDLQLGAFPETAVLYGGVAAFEKKFTLV